MDYVPFFSIIIPVYNGLSNGLPRCLESVWTQPLDSSCYEVICVDDCSTDNTREWLKSQSQAHTNLIVIENETNLRQGGARNKGFKVARGKYIMLIDQDDYYHPHVFEQIYQHLQTHELDVFIVDCAYQSPGKESNVLQHNFPHCEEMTGDEIIEKNSIPHAPWKFIFLRSLVINNQLFFVENERIEDVDWVHKLTHYAQRAQYQPILFIHYNKTNVSTTMTTFKSSETVYSTLRLSTRLRNLTTTTFRESSPKVKNYLMTLSSNFAYLGLRNYFFFHDTTRHKRQHIIENMDANQLYPHLIVKIARSCPSSFSLLSNLCVPLGRLAMYIYRRIKY